MAKILKPRIRIDAPVDRRGGKGYAGSGDDYGQRLIKYIPLKVSGIYPVLDSALGAYIKDPVAGISPEILSIAVVLVLTVVIVIEIHRAYTNVKIFGKVRLTLQVVQTLFNVIAFILWTYTIKGQIWGGTNNPALVVILDGVFLLFAQYLPAVTRTEAEAAGLIPSPAQPQPDARKPKGGSSGYIPGS